MKKIDSKTGNESGSGGKPSGGKLWNINFLLLWQGQLVSAVGDTVYEIALGFWVLAVTGSTGLMGTLMAASTIPRVILSPFAGVLVDRSNRKVILVLMDILRGAAILFVAAAAFSGFIKIWMVFAAGIVIGVCAGFFNPAVGSAVPDLVPRDKIVPANSFFSMIRAGSGILGNSAGGFLYSILGAPVMFLVNGISYIFSSITELFIKVPAVRHEKKEFHFFSDFKDGLRFVWNDTGLRFLLTAAAVINFFAFIAIVLLIPFFRQTDYLGPGKYGITMAAVTGGMVLGMAVIGALKLKPEQRFPVFFAGSVLFVVLFAVFPVFHSFALILIFVGLAGMFNGIVNVLIQSMVQMTVPSNMRGKVMGLLETLTGGLTPLGMAAGGLLGEILPIPYVISGSFVMIALLMFPQLARRPVREFFGRVE